MTTRIKLVAAVGKVANLVDSIDGESASLFLQFMEKVINAPDPNAVLRKGMKAAIDA